MITNETFVNIVDGFERGICALSLSPDVYIISLSQPEHAKRAYIGGRKLINLLASGERAVIFPEGGLNKGTGVKRRPRRGISYVAAKSDKLILPLKIESNLDRSVNNVGGKVIDILTRKHWIKMVFGKPFKIEETIGKIPESLSELRKASEGVFKRIEAASENIK